MRLQFDTYNWGEEESKTRVIENQTSWRYISHLDLHEKET